MRPPGNGGMAASHSSQSQCIEDSVRQCRASMFGLLKRLPSLAAKCTTSQEACRAMISAVTLRTASGTAFLALPPVLDASKRRASATKEDTGGGFSSDEDESDSGSQEEGAPHSGTASPHEAKLPSHASSQASPSREEMGPLGLEPSLPPDLRDLFSSAWVDAPSWTASIHMTAVDAAQILARNAAESCVMSHQAVRSIAHRLNHGMRFGSVEFDATAEAEAEDAEAGGEQRAKASTRAFFIALCECHFCMAFWEIYMLPMDSGPSCSTSCLELLQRCQIAMAGLRTNRQHWMQQQKAHSGRLRKRQLLLVGEELLLLAFLDWARIPATPLLSNPHWQAQSQVRRLLPLRNRSIHPVQR